MGRCKNTKLSKIIIYGGGNACRASVVVIIKTTTLYMWLIPTDSKLS